ncbi:MAG: hypothetical protein JNL74_20380 [Fibrobacteres bacterium]|nr:hypothetical protein [Fibrobacterota bacterium]
MNINLGYGFTNYSPDDLNEVNRIFEATSRAAGFNGYTVEPFNGHLETMLGIGVEWPRFVCALEAEIWRENFSQRGVAFSTSGLTGTVDADEKYLFLPITLMLKYPIKWNRFLFTPGYGAGIMFGGASIRMATKYTSSNPDDELNLKFTSGFNQIHRLGFDLFYKVFSNAGVGMSAGYRFSKIPYLEVSEVNGYSKIFNILFNGGADKGDKLYTKYESLNFIAESERTNRDHLVVGDMTGFYLWLKLFLQIGGKER